MSMGRSSGFGPVNVTLPAIFAPSATSGFNPRCCPKRALLPFLTGLATPSDRSSVAKPATIKQFRKIPSATAEYLKARDGRTGYYREPMPTDGGCRKLHQVMPSARRSVYADMAAAVIIFTIAQSALVLLIFSIVRVETLTWFCSPHRRIEILSTAATAVLFLGLLGLGARTWAGVQFTPAPPGSEPVEVLARQFAWTFRYPGRMAASAARSHGW